MIRKSDLIRWRDFLSREITHFERSGAVGVTYNDPEVFVFKVINDALTANREIDSIVDFFIANSTWPTLTPEQIIYVLHRLVAARVLLNHMILNSQFLPKAAPHFESRPGMLRWLLITNWHLGGADYMKAWADDFLAKNPPPPGYRVANSGDA